MNIQRSTPIQVGPALQCLLDHNDYFGPRDPLRIITHDYLEPLMNSLPHARNGLMLRGIMYTLLALYAKNNSLTRPRNQFASDAIMEHCFGGNIPVQHIVINRNLLSMSDALDRGLIAYPLNTFEEMNHIYPNFNPDNFNITHLMELVYLNSREVNVPDHVRQELQNEQDIIIETIQRWNQFLREKREGRFTPEQEELFQNYMDGASDIKEPQDY